jgi:hypothetical protein
VPPANILLPEPVSQVRLLDTFVIVPENESPEPVAVVAVDDTVVTGVDVVEEDIVFVVEDVAVVAVAAGA